MDKYTYGNPEMRLVWLYLKINLAPLKYVRQGALRTCPNPRQLVC